MGELYRLRFPSGKAYVGITVGTAQRRFRKHVANTNAGLDNAVHSAIKKYGAESVEVETLVVASDWDYLCELEKCAIEAFGTLAPKGYNLTTGGEGVPGRSPSPEERERIAAKLRGRKIPEEQRLRLVEGLRRRAPPTAETRAKLSKANKGRKITPEHRAKSGLANIGRVISEESKAKQRATVFAKGGGVCYCEARGKWLAYVKVARKTKVLGRFDTEAKAREVRNEALAALHPEA